MNIKIPVELASNIMYNAKINAKVSRTRLGQALMNELPTDIYRLVSGSEFDMFYFNDDNVAEKFFWDHFV